MNPEAPAAVNSENFGTERDVANCPFFLKTGACRFGDRYASMWGLYAGTVKGLTVCRQGSASFSPDPNLRTTGETEEQILILKEMK